MINKSPIISDRKSVIGFLTTDNRVPIAVLLITLVLFFGGQSSQTARNSEDINELKKWREEDHNTLKDVQGDVKSILKQMDARAR